MTSTGERRVIETIDDDLERWARWRVVRSYGLGYPKDSTGKLMDGMRSTTCPDCRGEGRIPGHRVGSALAFIDPCPQCHGRGKVAGDFTADESSRTVKCKECKGRGEVNGTTCPPCRGTGKHTNIRHYRINPAGIKSTRQPGADDDPLSHRIDWLVCTVLTEDERTVIMHEYCWSRTRQQALKRLRVDHQTFLVWLDGAKEKISIEVHSQ